MTIAYGLKSGIGQYGRIIYSKENSKYGCTYCNDCVFGAIPLTDNNKRKQCIHKQCKYKDEFKNYSCYSEYYRDNYGNTNSLDDIIDILVKGD